jgi:hypothetical protein
MSLGERLQSVAHFYRGAHGVWRELLAVAICLGVGLVVMPCLIFAAGRAILGPYAHGSLFALWHDFLQRLLSGSHAAWFIAVGPYVLFWLLRGGRWLLRHNPPPARSA